MDGGRQAGRQAGFGDTTDYDGGGIVLQGSSRLYLNRSLYGSISNCPSHVKIESRYRH